MNIAETVTVMRTTYGRRPVVCFSDPARCQSCPAPGRPLVPGADQGSGDVRPAQTVTGAPRPCHHHAHARGKDLELAMVVARYCDGVSPTISVKRELNEPSDVQPTATQVR